MSVSSTTEKIEESSGAVSAEGDGSVHQEKFFPAGAIAFFICLVLLSLLFWYGIYFLMIERA